MPDNTGVIKKEPISVIFYIPNIKDYIDRIDMISRLATMVDRLILVTSRIDTDIGRCGFDPALEIIESKKINPIPCLTPFRVSSAVESILEKEKIDIVHDTFGHLYPLFAKKKKYPDTIFVTSLYNNTRYDLKTYYIPKFGMQAFFHKKIFKWLYRIFMAKRVIKSADCVVMQSDGGIKELASVTSASRDKMVVLRNSVRTVEKRKTTGRPGAQTADKKIRILSVTELSFAKGGDHLLEFIRLCNKLNIKISVTMLDIFDRLDETYFREAIESPAISDKVVRIGRQTKEEMGKLFNEHDFLFQMSRCEGSPRVVLEALSHGLPVIGSEIPGIRVLDPESEFIIFPDKEDFDALAKRVADIANDQDRYREISSCGLLHIEKNHTSTVVADQYLRLYKKLVQAKKR